MATKYGAAGPSKRQSSANLIGVSFCASAAPEKSIAASNAAHRMTNLPVSLCPTSLQHDACQKTPSNLARSIPAVEQPALVVRHPREVARRHRAAEHRLLVDRL